MIKKILLVCAGGFSTSMLVEKMKVEAKSQGIVINIEACGEGSLEQNLPADIIMLGPQMGYAEDEVRNKVDNKIPVTVIDMMDYGMMDGKKVLRVALDMI